MSDNAAIVACIAILIVAMASCQAVGDYSRNKYRQLECTAPNNGESRGL